jgi:hypothetical protein
MSTHAINLMAYDDFAQASNDAGDLAERIGKHARDGATNAKMVELLKAWQVARHEARSSLERALCRDRLKFHSNLTAKAN